jgi:hypothetical protein
LIDELTQQASLAQLNSQQSSSPRAQLATRRAAARYAELRQAVSVLADVSSTPKCPPSRACRSARRTEPVVIVVGHHLPLNFPRLAVSPTTCAPRCSVQTER